MMREKKNKCTRLITKWHPRYGKRNRSRQNKRWKNDIRKIAGPIWTRTAKEK